MNGYRLPNLHALVAPAFCLMLLGSCAAMPAASDAGFYQGLLRLEAGDREGAAELFGRSLGSANALVREEAAAELLRMHLTEGPELPAALLRRVGKAAGGIWAEVYAVVEADDTGRALALMLDRSTPQSAFLALRSWYPGIPDQSESPAENSALAEAVAIEARLASSRRSYREALALFRQMLAFSPEPLFKYPDLISDLGTAFQYASADVEGRDFLLALDRIASSAGTGLPNDLPEELVPHAAALAASVVPENEAEIRFRLLFFAGRIARQHGRENIPLFQQALPFAMRVSDAQVDATVWYVLRSAVDKDVALTVDLLARYLPLVTDDSGLWDIADSLSRQLIGQWQWDKVLRVFGIFRERESGITAKFAWLAARAVQEGYVPAGQLADLGLPPGDPVPALMRIAFVAGRNSPYYRLRSTEYLDEPFLVLPTEEYKPEPPASAVLNFLLGFFRNDAGHLAPGYVRAREGSLTTAETGRVARAIAATGNHLDAIALINRHSRSAAFDPAEMSLADWRTWYPRPFAEIVERHSAEAGIEPELMFALIRTESAFMPAIASRVGAAGLTQLMPGTAKETADRLRRRGVDIDPTALDLTDPETNVLIGASYLQSLILGQGDLMLALLAYNGGQGRVRSWRSTQLRALGLTLPPDIFIETVPFSETRNYARAIAAGAATYRMLYFEEGE
ncbi:MAG: lytic transglycosylase domain-containing protein [Treponema sp.]|nr:lytic transglycosylase domain-containing protein [Treponema sp.]